MDSLREQKAVVVDEGSHADASTLDQINAERKTLLSIRLDADIIGGFRSAGPGYQVRMNQALRDYAVRQGWIAQERASLRRARGRPRKSK